MATDADEAGFLSRWSRRKVQVRQGQPLAEPAAPSAVTPLRPAAPTTEAAAVPAHPAGVADVAPAPLATTEAPAEPSPTLADVALLTRDSDYTRFMARGVQPDVKNAALGKLFTDPHFNVMDGLDTYIDDYGKPDPLPPGMLRQMVQSKMLGLFDDEDEEEAAKAKAEAAAHAQTPPANQAQPEAAALPPPDPSADENTDLQLQPDDDAGRAGPEAGAGQDPGRAH
jgi:hypothetical protein